MSAQRNIEKGWNLPSFFADDTLSGLGFSLPRVVTGGFRRAMIYVYG
jgi:hypothetical protein